MLRVRNTYSVEEQSNEELARKWGDWLKARLDEREWRQADLVRESGGMIKRDRVSKWVAGLERPTFRNATRISNALGIERREVLEAAFLIGTEPDFSEPTVEPRSLFLTDEELDLFDNSPEGRAYVAKAQRSSAFAAFSDAEMLEELLERARTRSTPA